MSKIPFDVLLYQKGYQQAQQDLALTPADIRNIIYLYREEWNESPADDAEDIFERVLNRFNKIKGKKK